MECSGTLVPRTFRFSLRVERFKIVLAPKQAQHISGGYGGRDTPVPIPNTEVKPASADGTWGKTPWESRTPPESFCKYPAALSVTM